MRYVTLLLFLLVPLANHAGVYKWIDDNGKVHYGDKPITTQPSVEINVDDSAPAPSLHGGLDQLSREEKRERLLQSMQAQTTFSQHEVPPRDSGTTWSTLSSLCRKPLPQY